MDYLIAITIGLAVVGAALLVARFAATAIERYSEISHKKWAMNRFQYTEEEYEEYERLSKARDAQRTKNQRQESLEVLEFMRKKYGND